LSEARFPERRRRARLEEGWLFLSHFIKPLDAKGRVSLPAPFRAALGKEEGVFVHPALDRPALDCGGSKWLAAIQSLLETMPPYSPQREDLSLALLGASEMLKPDPEGRLHLSERLKTAIGLTREAAFVGQGDKFQIWAAEAFAERLAAARRHAREWRERAP
jgi:MraZ protein